jgi:phosphomannomutase/phosphoglucomutase
METMKWPNVQLLFAEVDGSYPNHEADPVKEKNMQDVKHVLTTTDIQVGMGLDGDCDRMAAMTKEGFLVPGDQLLAVFAQPIVREHPGAAVVFDIKSSGGLIELLERWGAKPCLSPSGHAIIKDRMKQEQALLGGELSCHFYFHDRYFGYDDGVYAILRLFELLVTTGKRLEELLEIFPKKVTSPEYRIFCPDEKKHGVVQAVTKIFAQRSDVDTITIDGVRATMDYGWGIIRVSNTQPAICLRFESDTPQGLQQVKNDFMQVLAPYFEKEFLYEQLK